MSSLPQPAQPCTAATCRNGFINSDENITTTLCITCLTQEIQIHILTYLRAYDLAYMAQTCTFYHNPLLIHQIVEYTATQVYPPDWTRDFQTQLLLASAHVSTSSTTNNTRHTTTWNKSVTPKSIAKQKSISSSSKNIIASKSSQDVSKSRTRRGKFKEARDEPLTVVNSMVDDNEGNQISVSENETMLSSMEHGMMIDTDLPSVLYSFEHLRNIELLVVARVLSCPEPSVGKGCFFISKSWCKTALLWLEYQQEEAQKKALEGVDSKMKKLSKKKQRLRDRRLSDVSPPWPNANADLICEHDCLLTSGKGSGGTNSNNNNNKSARARRKLLDKQAWRVLKKLFPHSTPLHVAQGECLQCTAEAETHRRVLADAADAAKLQRKQPLSVPAVRKFYTRTRGVPQHCLIMGNTMGVPLGHTQCSAADTSAGTQSRSVEVSNRHNGVTDNQDLLSIPSRTSPWKVDMDTKMRHGSEVLLCCECDFDSKPSTICPLIPGTYYVLPRAWCHAWRKYIKSGEGGYSSGNLDVDSCSVLFPPPDASGLLCDAHRLPLLPPHLESFLNGESGNELWVTTADVAAHTASIDASSSVLMTGQGQRTGYRQGTLLPDTVSTGQEAVERAATHAALVPGQAPDDEIVQALRAAGLTTSEVISQLSAMRQVEHEQHRRQRAMEDNNVANLPHPGNNTTTAYGTSRNELLDKENHLVVEILSEDEFRALVEACWPSTAAQQSLFCLNVTVNNHGKFNWSIQPCRNCDATGRCNSLTVRNRARNWVRRSVDRSGGPASLEY
jgi:hypothetical protein